MVSTASMTKVRYLMSQRRHIILKQFLVILICYRPTRRVDGWQARLAKL